MANAARSRNSLLMLNPIVLAKLAMLELAGGRPCVLGLPGGNTNVLDSSWILEDGRDLFKGLARSLGA